MRSGAAALGIDRRRVRRRLVADVYVMLFVFTGVTLAFDYERPLVKLIIALPFWAAIRVRDWMGEP